MALENLQYLNNHEPQRFDFCIECTPTDRTCQSYHHQVKIKIIYEGTNNLVSGAFLKCFCIVERHEYDDFSSEKDYLVEPTEHFQAEYPLQMASTLVDINEGCICKVRMLNPFPTAMPIKQDAVIGRAEPIQGKPVVIVSQEDQRERENYTSARRVKLVAEEVKENMPANVSRAINQDENLEIPAHLDKLYNKTTEGLGNYEKKRVALLLCKFADGFSKDEWDLGLTHLTSHHRQKEQLQSKSLQGEWKLAFAADEKKAIEDLKAKRVIRESVSPWASPIVLVKKKDGGVRPCVAYRKVNELVKPDGFPLPRIQDCLDAVAGSELFSIFDQTSGYFQIPLLEQDNPKSAFVCKIRSL